MLTLPQLTAIRAIVACSPAPGRDRLLNAIDAAMKDARQHETEVTTVGLGGSDGTL